MHRDLGYDERPDLGADIVGESMTGGTGVRAGSSDTEASIDGDRASVDGPWGAAEDRLRAIATDYVDSLRIELDRLDVDAIMRIVERLRAARDAGAMVFTAGNGGSAATASHWVNDLGKATRRSGQRPFRIVGLADNISWFSALANDEGYERVFAGQLENLARPGDVLMVISASGNSPNVIRAVEDAREAEMTSIGLLGFDGGRALKLVDEAFWVRTPKGAYGLVETIHTVVCDIVTSCLIEDRLADRHLER
jgi:D-sedoheptulose 7-phosphate isomerase